MKNLKLLPLLLCLFTFVLISESCTKEDSCPEIECNTGTVNSETCACDCPTGFSGTNCEAEDLCITNAVDCLNGGTCVDGTCECAPGYEGADCSTLSALKFEGQFDVIEACDGYPGTPYSVTIAKSATDDTKIIMTSFGNLNCYTGDLLVEAVVDNNSFTITEGIPYCMDSYPNFSGYFFTGSGTITDNVIQVTYTYNFTIAGSETSVNCTATMTKQ